MNVELEGMWKEAVRQCPVICLAGLEYEAEACLVGGGWTRASVNSRCVGRVVYVCLRRRCWNGECCFQSSVSVVAEVRKGSVMKGITELFILTGPQVLK
jgi:hypothetical protein